jgi:hypothetical protein
MREVRPLDYRDHRPLALTGLNLWENHGWMVWNRSGDEDILLWLSPYRIVGYGPASPFSVRDIALSQTLLLQATISGADRTGMHDNPFLAVGYDLGDHLPPDALHIEVSDTSATWRVGKRCFVAAPPRWQIHGEHAGVAVELELTAMGGPFWLTDPGCSVEDSEELWLLQCARARGNIKHNGRITRIDGFASHERHVHCGTRYDPPLLLSAQGVTWHSGGSNDTQIIIMSRPALGLAWARLVWADDHVEFAIPDHDGRIEEVEFWIDPQSRLQVPVAWRSVFDGPAGTLEVEARAKARAYYLWPNFARGCTILYWWLADAHARYRLADGRSAEFDLQYVVHDNRLLYRQHRDD